MDTIECMKNKLYFATLKSSRKEVKSTSSVHFFTIDDELIYNNFYNDFGPLNIACLYRYCWKLSKKLKNPSRSEQRIVHYTSQDERKWTNSAYLISSYSVLYLKKNPKEINAIFMNFPRLQLFSDASMGPYNYRISLLDCLNAIQKAAYFGFFNFEDFDILEYEKYEKVQHGDFNWIIPKKFLAFAGPSTEPDTPYNPPQCYIDYFLKNDIAAVIRLNKKSYDAEEFSKVGILHYDMYMPDGTVPSRKILNKFLQVAESPIGAIAVHCKAGLGRTGSLIAAYLIKHYQMRAREAIAWLRICRPGSVIGHQQTWLEKMEGYLMFTGYQFKMKHFDDADVVLRHKYGIYSLVKKEERKLRDQSGTDCGSSSCAERSPKKAEDSRMKMEKGEEKNKSRYFDERREKSVLTQGDRLNEIKLKRSRLSRGTESSRNNKKVLTPDNFPNRM